MSLELFDSLDEGWERYGVSRLPELLSSLGADPPRDLAIELCSGDLEWRWRHFSFQDRAIDSHEVSGDPKTPNANDYRRYLSGFWNSDCLRLLLETEWCSRSMWQDSPNADEFAKQLPDQPDWSDHLLELLSDIKPLGLRVGSMTDDYRVGKLPSVFSFGRQSQGEPPPPCWLQPNAKIVFANYGEREYSREQLRIRRVRCNAIQLENRNKASIVINGSLFQGSMTEILLPVEIKLNERFYFLHIADN